MAKHLPMAVMEKLLKKAGANRVSESAKTELQRALEKRADEISHKAIIFSKHAGRKTVTKEDILLALGR